MGQPVGDAGSGGATEPAMFDAWVGTAEDRNDVAGGAVCERIATIQCAGEGHCCEEPGRSFEACKQTMKQGCIDGLLLDQTTTNAVAGYDRGFAAGVLTEYERRARQCDISVAAWGASTAGFRALNRGTLASGASCKPSALDIFGQTPMAVAHMFACTSPETQACLPTATEWRCVSHAAEGGACFTDLNCAEGLFCTNSKARSPGGGTCEARKADGAACDFPSDCSSLACKGGTCAPASQQTIFCLQ